jgi:DNA repair protein RadC
MRIVKYKVQLVKERSCLYATEDGSKAISSPQGAYEAIEKTLNLSSEPKENFGILALNTKNHPIGLHIISVGSINASIASPRDVFMAACLNNAAAIILFHNHPSGDPTPSSEDVVATNRLCEAGKIMGIQVLDHIIIGENGFKSLKENGYLR